MGTLIGVLFGLCLLVLPFLILYLLLEGAARNRRTRENVAALESRLLDLNTRVESLTLRTARLEDENDQLRSRATAIVVGAIAASPAAAAPAPRPLEVAVPRPPEERVLTSPEVPGSIPPASPVHEGPDRILPVTGAIEPPSILTDREDRAKAPRAAWREQLAGADWEARVGGNWLNKAGVLVFVIGLSLFLGYSLTRFGPAGRVAIGWSISVALLAGGTMLERRPGYALFGQGLLAGGWGGAYFTAYAMHAVPAARVIESPIAGAVLLMSVATGMVLHSLRYRSEALTGLTYFVAFATLNITPVSSFTLLASAPLAASLLTITYRHRWTTMSVVGLTFTYGSLLMRLGTSMSSATVGELWIVQAILVTYWLLFELFDLIAPRSRTSGPVLGALFPLNATGFLGLSVLLWSDHPGASVYLFGLSAAGYLASAVARALLKPVGPPADAGVARGTGNDDLAMTPGYEASVTVAAALAAGTIVLEFHGIQLSTALALEGELLFMSGLRLKASYLRGLASIVLMGALVTTLPVLTASSPDTIRLFGVALYMWVPMATLIAAVFYMNAALVRSTTLIAAEPLYLGAGTALLVGIVGDNTPARHLGIAWLVLAFWLLEVGIRTKADQLLFQALLVGTLAVGDILWITEFRGGASYPSLMLGVSGALTAVAAFRLFNSRDVQRWIQQFLGAAAALASVVLMTACAWHALPGPMVAVAWGALALALVGGGRALGWRWLARTGDVLAMVVFARLFASNLRDDGDLWGLSTRLITVVPCVALFYYLGASVEGVRAIARDWRARAFVWMAFVLAVALMRFELERVLTAAGWSAFAVGLLVVALHQKDDDLLNQSYVVAAGAAIRAWIVNGEGPDWAGGGFSIELMVAGVVVLCLYACQFLVPREWANVQGTDTMSRRWIDRHARELFSGVATSLLAIVLFHDVPSRLLTIAWALQGLMLLAVGFTAREPVLRRSGLVLLAVCLTKVLGYDSRQLDTLARIVSFMLLGAVLILVSWIYTRFGSRVRRFL